MRVWERSRLALRSVFGAQNQNVWGRFLYSSISNPTNKNTEERLYRRISPVGNPNVSVVPILEQWVQEGKPVSQIELQRIIKELRIFKRFHHALEVSLSFLLFFSFLFIFWEFASHSLLLFLVFYFSYLLVFLI